MKRIKKFKKYMHCIILGALCFLSVSAFAQQRSLLQYVSNPDLDSKQQHFADAWIKGEEVISYKYAVIDEKLFQSNFLSLNLPSGQVLQVEKRGERNISRDMFSWLGNLNGMFGNADFVVHGDMITARISSSSFIYQIYPITGGMHVIIQTGNYPHDESDEGYRDAVKRGEETAMQAPEKRIDAETGQDPESMLAGDCKVRVLVAYTDDFAANSADPIGFVNSCIDATNTAYDNSLISFNVELAVSFEVTYTETLNSATDKTRFRNTADGYIDNIHTYRNYFDADLNVLLTENLQSGICGEAYTVANSPYADAFCVCKRTCAVGNLSFPHELGHLYGARHDPYVDNTSTPYAYGHGYVYFAGLWRTVMAYNDYCDDNGSSCTRIQWFSNPAVNYNGHATGVSGANDNESSHESSRANISSLEVTNSAKSFPAAYTFSSGEQFDVIANTSITAGANSFVLNSGSNGVFRSGDYSTLSPGFWAKSGSKFNAYTDACTALFAKNAPGTTNNSISKTNAAQVQPNPFNDKIEISFMSAEEAVLKVQLFDALGNLVKTLDEQSSLAPGIYGFNYSTSDIKAGVYFINVTINGTSNMSKVVKVN